MNNRKEYSIDSTEQVDNSDSSKRLNKERHLPISKANTMAKELLNHIAAAQGEDDEDSRDELDELIQRIYIQKQQSGDADDFLNFAITLARYDEYMLACKILECGLKSFPKNVDLIACFLQYGTKCNRVTECKQLHKNLLKITYSKWTWRGFAFLVDYLRFLGTEQAEKEMFTIVDNFKTYFPYDEESYYAVSVAYRELNRQDDELKILEEALLRIKVAPKCALRYADILFNRGLYDESVEAIKRGINDANQTQSSVSQEYIFYLSALSKIAIAFRSNANLKKAEVHDIYSDFNIALKRFTRINSSYWQVIQDKTDLLISKTGFPVPDEYDRLVDCIDTQ